MNNVYKKIILSLGMAAVALPVTAANVEVEQCWVRLLPSHLPSAGYLVLHNHGAEPVQLVAASSPSYKEVMLHETIEVDGMAKMQMAHNIIVPAHDSVHFAPGGLHLMYEQPTGALQVGDTMALQLRFNNEPSLSVNCKVQAAKSRFFEE